MTRPRLHPVGMPDSERTAIRRRQLRDDGGRTIQLDLSREAWQALQCLAEPRGRRALLERLILEERTRRG